MVISERTHWTYSYILTRDSLHLFLLISFSPLDTLTCKWGPSNTYNLANSIACGSKNMFMLLEFTNISLGWAQITPIGLMVLELREPYIAWIEISRLPTCFFDYENLDSLATSFFFFTSLHFLHYFQPAKYAFEVLYPCEGFYFSSQW